MIQYLLIGLLALSVFSMGAFYFAINLLNKRKEKKNIDIRNTFPYEVFPQLKTDNFFINILYLLATLSPLAGIILFMSQHLGIVTIFTSVIATLFTFFIVVLPFVDISKLKEHLYLSIGMVVTHFALSGFVLYLSYSICKLYDYKNVSAIISLVLCTIIFVGSLVFVINPRLFDLKMEVEDEEVKRPKFIPLANAEWIIIFISSLFLIPLILLQSIL